MGLFTQFQFKIRTNSSEKVLNLVLLDKYFTDNYFSLRSQFGIERLLSLVQAAF